MLRVMIAARVFEQETGRLDSIETSHHDLERTASKRHAKVYSLGDPDVLRGLLRHRPPPSVLFFR